MTKHYKKINQAIVPTYFYNTLLKFDLTNTRRHFEPYKKLKNNTEYVFRRNVISLDIVKICIPIHIDGGIDY